MIAQYCVMQKFHGLHRIDAHFLIKITDFGLSEDVFEKNYFRQGSHIGESVKLPVKWMAPESLSDGHFSEKSDVVQPFLHSLGVTKIAAICFKYLEACFHI